MSCCYCLKNFNKKSRIPMTLSCSHKFCNKCMLFLSESSNFCPLDTMKVSFDNAYIETEIFESFGYQCKLHQSEIIALCYSHFQLICQICNSQHSGCKSILLKASLIYELVDELYSTALSKSSYLLAFLDTNKIFMLDESFTKLDLKTQRVSNLLNKISQEGTFPLNINKKLSLINETKNYSLNKAKKLFNQSEIKKDNEDSVIQNPLQVNKIWLDNYINLVTTPLMVNFYSNIYMPYTNHVYCFKNNHLSLPLWQKIEKYVSASTSPMFLFNEIKIEKSLKKTLECFVQNTFNDIYTIRDFAVGTPTEPKGKLFIRLISIIINEQEFRYGPYILDYKANEIIRLINLTPYVTWTINSTLSIKIVLEGQNFNTFFNPYMQNVLITRGDGSIFDENFPVLFINLSKDLIS